MKKILVSTMVAVAILTTSAHAIGDREKGALIGAGAMLLLPSLINNGRSMYQEPARTYESPRYESPRYESQRYESPRYESNRYESQRYESPRYGSERIVEKEYYRNRDGSIVEKTIIIEQRPYGR